MAKVFQCDRCGNVVQKSDIYTLLSVYSDGDYTNLKVHLCRDCMADVKHCINNPERTYELVETVSHPNDSEIRKEIL